MTNKELKESNKKIITRLVIAVVLMFGFGYAMVPLYNTFCNITGLNGKTSGRYQVDYAVETDTSRTIKIQFITNLNKEVPWEFRPLVKSLTVHPGEIKQASFYVKNLSNKTIIGRAIPSISPGIVAKHMHKTECFCFNEQLLRPGESKLLPLMFFIGKEFPKGYSEMTLSYTLFDTYKIPPLEEMKDMLNIW
jgi:cytochrome c oxidase assembly protein subunit 11